MLQVSFFSFCLGIFSFFVPVLDALAGRGVKVSGRTEEAAMFEILRTTQLETVSADVQGPYTVIPGPPAGWVPPIGASANTWANIYKNKQRIDYCYT